MKLCLPDVNNLKSPHIRNPEYRCCSPEQHAAQDSASFLRVVYNIVSVSRSAYNTFLTRKQSAKVIKPFGREKLEDSTQDSEQKRCMKMMRFLGQDLHVLMCSSWRSAPTRMQNQELTREQRGRNAAGRTSLQRKRQGLRRVSLKPCR